MSPACCATTGRGDEDSHLEEDDPEDQGIDAVCGQRHIELICWQQVMDRLPTGENDQQSEDLRRATQLQRLPRWL